MNKLSREILPILQRRFIYCDVGARWGISEPWNLFKDLINFICFEPDKEEYESLKKKISKNVTIYQNALYKEKSKVTLNLTKSRGCSSLFKPNKVVIKNYPDSAKFEIEETVSMDALSLDELYKEKAFSNLDFIKIDVQGAELDVLKGGKSFLSENSIGIEVEVEFQELYEKQPLFSDVDCFIRNSIGLHIQDLRKTYWKYPEGIGVGATKGQLIFGDALYFRPPSDIVNWCSNFCKEEASNKILMACLMGLVYGYIDYSLCILNQSTIGNIVDKEIVEKWKKLIISYGKCFKFNKFGANKLSQIFNLCYRICQPSYEGWASIGNHLGNKKQFMVFR